LPDAELRNVKDVICRNFTWPRLHHNVQSVIFNWE